MIEVRFPPPTGNRFEMSVSGHSGSGPKGFDIVCAAVSALTLTLLGGLQSVIGAEVKGMLKEGLCEVVVEAPGATTTSFGQAVEVFRYGFRRLAREHPEFVKFIPDGKGE